MNCQGLKNRKIGEWLRRAFKTQGCQRLMAIEFKVTLPE